MAKWSVRREGTNIIDVIRVPIVFVPGVMGSRLKFPDSDTAWDPDCPLTEMIHWAWNHSEQCAGEMGIDAKAEVMVEPPRALSETLAAAGQDMSPEQISRGWGGVAYGFYGAFLKWLERKMLAINAECTVYAIGYDWRQSNAKSGAYVAERVKNILDGEGVDKCILVSHSMGGLVTRAAMGLSALEPSVLGVVHVAQPAFGAVVAYRRFFTGGVSEASGNIFTNTGKTIEGFVFGKIMGDDFWEYAWLMSGLPGPMQLLPNHLYKEVNTDSRGKQLDWVTIPGYPTDDIYKLYLEKKSPPGLLGLGLGPDLAGDEVKTVPAPMADWKKALAGLEEQLNSARAFHAGLGKYTHPCTYAIAGNGLHTDVHVDHSRRGAPDFDEDDHLAVDNLDENDEDFLKMAYRRGRAGDGTVPFVSAHALKETHPVRKPWPAQPQYTSVVDGAEHAAIFNESEARDLTYSAIIRILERRGLAPERPKTT